MRAAIRYSYCSPDTLVVATVEKPIPADHEILVRIHTTTVNRTDCAILTGYP